MCVFVEAAAAAILVVEAMIARTHMCAHTLTLHARTHTICHCRLLEDRSGVVVQGLEEVIVRSAADIYQVNARARACRGWQQQCTRVCVCMHGGREC